MKRKLLRQIANEWRSNFWLVIELMIVSVAVWYMVTDIYMTYKVAHLPNGYNTENTYIMYRNRTPEASDILADLDSVARIETEIAQIQMLHKTVADMPGVIALGIGRNNMPYNYNFEGIGLTPFGCDSLKIMSNARYASPEMAEVMEWTPLAGASSTEDLKAVLERGEVIITRTSGYGISRVVTADELDKATPGVADGGHLKESAYLIGKTISGNENYTVGAVVEDMRRGKYEPAYYGSYVFPVRPESPEITDFNEIIVRIDPGRRSEFVKAFNDAVTADRLSLPLCYIAEMQYVDDIAKTHHAEVDISNRNYTIVIIFLMVSIFLGMMGTFGARTVKRRSEIAVRISAGASRADIFRRLIGEGAVLVVMATIPAAIIDWAIGWYVEMMPQSLGGLFSPWEFLLLCIAVSFCLIMLMTIAGIWFPARRAMALDPAVALNDQ